MKKMKAWAITTKSGVFVSAYNPRFGKNKSWLTGMIADLNSTNKIIQVEIREVQKRKDKV